jgi:hypothetical protein
MPDPALPQLADWGNFYVIIGSAAAGLTGLMFVVITLGAQAQTIGSEKGLQAFVTPTVVHFCSALIVAVYMSTPGQNPESLGAGAGLGGAAGLTYVAWAMRAAKRLREYEPVGEDWLWHGAFPTLAYAVLVGIAAMFLTGHTTVALYTLAADTMFLLLTAIHNAWDAAAWVALSSRRRQTPAEKKKGSHSGAIGAK